MIRVVHSGSGSRIQGKKGIGSRIRIRNTAFSVMNNWLLDSSQLIAVAACQRFPYSNRVADSNISIRSVPVLSMSNRFLYLDPDQDSETQNAVYYKNNLKLSLISFLQF
jgi:hypothetical protein